MKNLIIILLLCTSCSAFVFKVPDQAKMYVTTNDVCRRENVTIDVRNDIFSSVLRLKYYGQTDSVVCAKLFRTDGNTYYGYCGSDLYKVKVNTDDMLDMKSDRKHIVVNYERPFQPAN